MIITINAEAYRHCARFASTEQNRPILGGVYAQPDGTLVATNGHIMLVWPHAVEGATRPVILKTNKRLSVKLQSLVVNLPDAPPSDGDRRTTAIQFATRHTLPDIEVTEIEGPYPNWQAVIPAPETLTTTGPVGPLNPEYLGRFEDIGGMVRLIPSTNLERAIVVRFQQSDAFGLIMPWQMRDFDAAVLPAWWTKQTAKADAA